MLSWPLLTFVGVLMVSFIVQSIQFVKPGRTMATIAGTVLVVAYVGLLGSFIIQMRWFDGPYHGIVPLVVLIATAKGADTGAYTVGRMAGAQAVAQPEPEQDHRRSHRRHGLRGSGRAPGHRYGSRVASSSGAGGPEAVGFGLLVGVAAQLGDLMESMIKRDCERKDASSAVPGFGGVLDVLDSLLFAGPVAYGYWVASGPRYLVLEPASSAGCKTTSGGFCESG